MKYVMSWTDAPTFHHDLPFIPLHYTYVPFTSSPQLTSLHFTPLHFTDVSTVGFGGFGPTWTKYEPNWRLLSTVTGYNRTGHIRFQTIRQETITINILDKYFNINRICTIAWKEWMRTHLLGSCGVRQKVGEAEIDGRKVTGTNSVLNLAARNV
jgi:hypothetical protein